MASHPVQGRHLLVEMQGCTGPGTTDPRRAEELLRRAAAAAGVQVVGACAAAFPGGGVAAVVLLAESHLSLHTWPEVGYAAADVYTCGAAPAERAVRAIVTGLQARHHRVVELARGPDGPRWAGDPLDREG